MKKEPFENCHHRTIYLPEFFQTHPDISLALIYLKTFVERVAACNDCNRYRSASTQYGLGQILLKSFVVHGVVFFYLNCKLYHIMQILVITFDTLRIEDEKKDIWTKIFRFAIFGLVIRCTICKSRFQRKLSVREQQATCSCNRDLERLLQTRGTSFCSKSNFLKVI